jgi:drug/metabolite transporter (DMT)-like permease
MDTSVLLLVLVAALLHAVWNAAVKFDDDRLGAMAVLVLGCGLLSALALPWVDHPAPASWPFLAASLACHFGYKVALVRAYSHGGFAQVYPIARGVAPLLVTLWAVNLFGESITPVQVAAIGAIIIGVLILAVRGHGLFIHNRRAVGYALLTALFISGYTVFDGIGVRYAGSPHGYVVWLFILDTIPFLLLALGIHKTQTLVIMRHRWRLGLIAGGMSLAAYWLVVWAMSLGSIPVVSALRETSIVFAALIGIFLFKEPMGARQVAAAASVAAGVIILRAV